jgi:2',3'-cyclic-nucleotide 2'-phosphodiesterase (5'-nucleotidase family)
MLKQIALLTLGLSMAAPAHSETLSFLASRNLAGDVSQILGVGEVTEKVKANGVTSVLIDLGGVLSPSEQSFEHRRKGSLTVDLMNQAGYTAWFLSGRDLVWANQLTKFLRRTDFPVLASNLHRAETGRHLFQVQPYTVIRASSLRIGLIGLAGEIAGVLSSDPVAAARYYAGMIASTCDLLMVVSSAGPDADKAIATTVSEVDLVIGHGAATGTTKTEGGLVVSVKDSQGLWGIDLTVENGELTEAIVSPMTIPAVDRVSINQSFIGWSAELEGEAVSLGTVIGLSEGGFQTALTSPLGYFVADVTRNSASTDGALVRADHFPADFVTGEITVYDLYRSYPLPFTVGVASIKGAEVMRLLAPEDGKFLYYPSGIDAVYSQGDAGLLEASIGGVAIDPRIDYTIAIELGASSDEALSGSRVRDTGQRVRDLVGKHVRTSGSVKGVVDGRIQKR